MTSRRKLDDAITPDDLLLRFQPLYQNFHEGATLSDKISADKIFGGQNFRRTKFSAVKIFGSKPDFWHFCPPKFCPITYKVDGE